MTQIIDAFANRSIESLDWKTTNKGWEEKNFSQSLLNKVASFSDPLLALEYLIQFNEITIAAQFIRLKYQHFPKRTEPILRQRLHIVAKHDPLAVSLFYQHLVMAVLEEGRHKSYKEAASDLARCTVLSYQIEDWEDFKPHSIFIDEIKEVHKRKILFWEIYRNELQRCMADKISWPSTN